MKKKYTADEVERMHKYAIHKKGEGTHTIEWFAHSYKEAQKKIKEYKKNKALGRHIIFEIVPTVSYREYLETIKDCKGWKKYE